MELVIYEPSILTKIHQKQQIFQFNGVINKTIVIHQEGRGTGGILWPAAELFSNFVLSSSFEPIKYLQPKEREWKWEEKTVLEIGSGLGLTSIILATLGSKVIATDGEETVVDQLSNNFDANLNEISRKNVMSCVYRWGDDLETILDSLNSNQQQTTEQEKDWFNFSSISSLSFDIVLATDVVYGEDTSVWSLLQHSFQLSTATATSSPTQTPIILIAQTERYPEKEQIFFNQMNELFVLRDVIDISGSATCALGHVDMEVEETDVDGEFKEETRKEKRETQQTSHCKLYVYTTRGRETDSVEEKLPKKS